MRMLVLVLALAMARVPSAISATVNHASAVIEYRPGSGTAPGYDQPASALGEPSRATPGEFAGPVDPFSSAWQPGQLVSLGTGGSLTVRFEQPVFDLPGNPFGVDFLIFGSAAFVITNGDFGGGGITDGSLFGNAAGPTRVSVSADGSTFFTLDPARTPTVDGLFPTDGQGDFRKPVDPRLREADFSGLGLSAIRVAYDGSGGGAGYDIGWARDADGHAVALSGIDFVRVEVLADRAEIDGFTAVPEPGAGSLALVGASAWLIARRVFRSSKSGSRR